jgi:DNA-directed RNA polymerase alpha subunit
MRVYANVRREPVERVNKIAPAVVPGEYIYFSRTRKPKPTTGVSNVHVFELDLAFRTKRILWWLKISTLEELSKLTSKDLIKIRGCNAATIKDIKRELKRFGIEPKTTNL